MTQEPLVASRPGDDFLTNFLVMVFQTLGMIPVGVMNSGFAAGEAFRQQSLVDYRITLMQPAEVAEALRRGLITDDQYQNVMERTGYSEAAIATYKSLLEPLLSIADLTTLWRRGELSDD